MRKNVFTSAAMVTVILLAGCSVNGSLELADGEVHSGNFSTVNGNVTLGVGSRVTGNAKTVNGSVVMAQQSQADAVKTVNGSVQLGSRSVLNSAATVNGSITLGDAVVVAGELKSVNGSVEVGPGSEVGGDVSTVNGPLLIGRGASVAGQLVNESGNITLLDDCRVEGGIYMREDSSARAREPDTLKIGSGCVVLGDIVLEREVRVLAHEAAELPRVVGEEVERFAD